MTAEMRIPLHDLREITNGFSVDSRIGKGGYGDVYKGVYNGRVVAVKLLHVDTVQGIDDQQYINEVGNLSRAKHPNIIQLLGYSYETTSELVEHNSKQRLSQHIYRALCFEYLQGGSLDMRLREKSLAPDWSTCYNIIKGICEGLNFLHGCKPAIFHLDLKPANILLDNAMVPKVADFGLSRVISQSHTQVTKQIRGTQAYMPPEFINGGNISHKNDVFSLGLVMVEIVTGSLGYSNSIEMDEVVQFKQKVHTDWKNRIKATSEYPLEELHQVQTCIDIAMRCLEPDRNNRPTIAEVLDILNKTETHIPKGQLADVLPCPIIGPNNTMANTLKEMAAELDNITNQNRHSSYMPENSSNVQQVTDIRETTSDVEKELIIGRTEEIQEIVATLCGSTTPENKITILPIYGMGGIGKTTLAQLVFNDSKFASYSQVWIYVSQNLDLNKVGNLIISQLLSEESHVTNKQMINKKLRELFAGKMILIVLDDVWETNPRTLKDLKAMLRPGVGSMVTVIVTTRDEAIAREICHTVGPYKLETLTNKSCWKIIKKQTAFKDRVDKKQLKHIGKEIATKCGGVALAAQSLGYTLKGKTSDEWESVRDNYIWNLTTSEDPSSTHHEVLASLLLSYSRMPDWLKLCFSYCAVFPKGHNIVKYDLIHQWIALGFIEQSNTFDSMQLCEKYVRQLLGMSFLQYAKTQPSSGRNQDKHAISFTMHDLVHDLAKEILSHQLNTGGNKCRYASLTDCSNSLQFLVNFPANIKALRFQDCGGRELCGGAFSSAKCLRVLDLSECLIKKLPDCIGQLKQLRFLHAPDIHNFEIPNCITKLSELNYLNLRCSRYISALPESIGDMKGLMHLDLSGCHQIRELPVSFSELKQLVHLDLSGCNMFLAEALGGCTKLQYLNLSVVFPRVHKRTTGLPEVIGNLIKLRYLNLSGCVDLMGPRPLRGQDPDWVEEIHRLLCSISTFSNLEHLVLSCNDQISSIPESFGNLTKLHTLDLTRCRFVRKLPDSIFKMVSLKVLIDSSIRLGESTLPRFNFISLPHFEVQSSSDKCSSNIILLQLTNPDELEIDKLENVKSAEEAMSVKLIEKLEITSLTFQWTLGAERFADDKVVLEKLVPPSSVWHLSITGYMSHSIPDWFMDIRQYVPTLVRIFRCYFPNCNNLPPLGQLPNLKELNLSRMEGLEEWNTTHYSGKEGSNELMFPKLVDLKIKQCPKLRIKPCLPRAIFLSIEDSDNMLSSWGESSTHIRDSSSSPVTELTVKDSKVPMHQWRLLYHLPALRALSIINCSDLSTSPDMTQHLSSIDLQQVELYGLDQAELPNWLAKLTSLDKLILSCCESMRSLPQWLGELTSLKEIDVGDCRQLEKWWASKENRRFIAHIDVTVEGFPSDSDEEDISNESSVLGDASDESNEETDEETTNSQDSESGSNQRKRPRYDGVSNPSSLPPTWMAPTIPRSRASDIITQEMSCHPPPSPVARDMMPSMPTAIAINAPALSVVAISDDDADDMNLSIICTSDDDRPTVKAPARPARLTPCRPARPTPCSPLGLLIASSPATPLFGDGAEVDIVPGTSGTHVDVLPRPGDILVDATYDADDEGPLLAASSGSWASLQRARKGKAKQNYTDIDYLDDVPIISNKMRSLLEMRELDAEAGSTGTAASTSSPAVLSLGLNAAASASVIPRCYQRSPAREEEDDAACGERPPEQTEDPEKRNSSRTEEEGDRFSFRFLFDAFLAVVACFCSPQT